MRSAVHFLSGSLVVYVLMAACAASGGKGSSGSRASAGANATETVGGMASATGGDGTNAAGAAGGSTPGASGNDPAVTSGAGGMIDMMMDPVPDANAETKSGTRLKARYYVGEDGSKQFIGWHDSARNNDCIFVKMADGKQHCIPLGNGASPIGYFTDSGCATRLFGAPLGTCSSGAINSAVTYDGPSCSYAVENVAPANPTDVYTGTPANCIKATPPANYAFFTSTGAAANSDFVAAVEQLE